MYEYFFGLNCRPFSATPDPNCFVATEAMQNALDTLVVCIENNQGIGILTAPAGLGKTLVCGRLVSELQNDFEVAFLGTANFSTRRSFLQAMVYELGQPYSRMSEQELRLELTTAAKGIRPGKKAIVIVIDEAHLLSERLLEEVRAITNLAENGESLIRVILSGQLELEEKLISPQLDAFNQRIGCQVSLETLTRQESANYVAQRLEWAGSETSKVFTPNAVELIAHVSDGVPRCINQLCDHSLLLAYVAEQKPADDNIIREALEDLKQLPLHWNEPPTPPSPLDPLRQMETSENPIEDDSDEHEPTASVDEEPSVADSPQPNRFSLPSHNMRANCAHAELKDSNAVWESESTSESFEIEVGSAIEVGAEIDLTPHSDTHSESFEVESDTTVEPVSDTTVEPVSDTTVEPVEDHSDHLTGTIEVGAVESVPTQQNVESVFEVGSVLELEVPPSPADSLPTQLESLPANSFEVSTDDMIDEPISAGQHDDQVHVDIEIETTTHDTGLVDESTESEQFEEEVVIDHYAALDARQQLSEASGIVWDISASGSVVPNSIGPASTNDAPVPQVPTAAETSFSSENAIVIPNPEGLDLSLDSHDQSAHVDAPNDETLQPECFEQPIAECRPDQLIDSIIPLLDEFVETSDLPAEELAMPKSSEPIRELDVQSQLVSESLQAGSTIEEQIGSQVLDTCLETQRALLDRLNQVESQRFQPTTDDTIDLTSSDDIPLPNALSGFDVIQPEPPRQLDIPEQTRPDSIQQPNGIREDEEEDPIDPFDRAGEHSPISAKNIPSPHRPYGRLFTNLRQRQRQ